MNLQEFFTQHGWSIVHTMLLPAKSATFYNIDDLSVSAPTRQLITQLYPRGLFLHQKEAIRRFTEGCSVCVTTSTASGKSLVFHAAAVEVLRSSPKSRVVVVYPLKALGKEQEDRWERAIAASGIRRRIGRIDGHTPVGKRLKILRESDILIFTPDIVHAWLFANLNDNNVKDLLRNLKLLIVDEIHNYTGVFGSNAAFLFRRLRHLCTLLNASIRFVCASATIAHPAEHLKELFGVDFTIVDNEFDTSPKKDVEITLVRPPQNTDLLTEVSQLLRYLEGIAHVHFLAFVDSRKQTEHLSAILARSQERDDEEVDSFSKEEPVYSLTVLPYRAGYEDEDRRAIQRRLSEGSLKGIISTSALELGIDIQHLNVGVLIGVPPSLTSLYQRIGRIGRHTRGTVIVVSTGDVYDEAVFRDPENFMNRPLAESSLYLENPRIQYIHALCLARQGGEHDQLVGTDGNSSDFDSRIEWPPGFIELCKKERLGEIPPDLQPMKVEAGDNPNHVFPLRDVESQFKVEHKHSRDWERLGSLSYSQLMREAYPGAVYYYITQPYRVVRVDTRSKTVQVRRERKRYTTQPIAPPASVFPNLTPDNVYNAFRVGDLVVIECNLQVRWAVHGFKERRGPNEITVQYPSRDNAFGFVYPRESFVRLIFTTGVVLIHPSFSQVGFNIEAFANLLYEVFLAVATFERRDIDVSVDRIRKSVLNIQQGSKFIAIYDQTYGSLRLSGRLMVCENLKKVFTFVKNLVEVDHNQEVFDLGMQREVIKAICHDALGSPSDLFLFSRETTTSQENCVQVIMPGSKGLCLRHNMEEFFVDRVFYSPTMNSVAYSGRRAYSPTNPWTVRFTDIAEIPGVSELGLYNPETGDLRPLR